jgi:hypothetical protein
MAFFTKPNSSFSFLTQPFDDDEESYVIAAKNQEDLKATGDSFCHKNESADDAQKPRLTSAQIAEQRLAQLRSHEVRNLTLAELQRLQHLTGDVHSRRLTLAELQKLQQQAPIVDSRHAELLKPRLVSFKVQTAQESRPMPEPAAENVTRKIEFDYDLELGVEV